MKIAQFAVRSSLVITAILSCISVANAGGPLVVGGPGFGVSGKAFVWNPAAMPIQYRVDGGPMSKNPSGSVIISNATGLTRVQGMFFNWQNAPNAAISYNYAGPIQATGAFKGGDVVTVSDFNAVAGSCDSGAQSPIVFDADGSIVSDLGLPPDIIGFASPCKLDTQTGYIDSGFALLNGAFQDNLNQPPNYELTSTQFDQAITHELGHFSGLDHSQINQEILYGSYPCNADDIAGLPLMFPIAYCQARVDAGLPVLSPDDQAWIAKLYPASTYAGAYGKISGYILFSDGITQAQGVNVIARRVDDPTTSANESRRIAVSVVSGFLFNGNPGQNVSGDNTNGDQNGSRDATLIGYYEIPVPPGDYTVQVESINSSFVSGSSVGPLDPPIIIGAINEYWHSGETAFDDQTKKETITVGAGQEVSNINIILNGTPSRFDQWEDSGAFVVPLEIIRKEMPRNGAPA
jgi:hypothetical protein